MTTQTGGVPSAGSLYTRQSSGLIRSIPLSASVGLNVTNIGLIFAILSITSIPAGFPTARPLWTAIICCVVCFPLGLLYGAWTATIPRSGGDYVWNGRVFGPPVGFVASFLAVVWYVLANGFLAYLLGADALPTAFQIFGRAIGNESVEQFGAVFSTPNAIFIIGIIGLLIGFVVAALGMRRAARIIITILILELIGMAVAFVVLVMNSPEQFAAAVSSVGGDTQAMISAAADSGHDRSVMSWSATLFAMPPLYLSIGYAVASAYAGGELSGAKKSGLWGPPLAVVIASVIIIGSFAAAGRTLGWDFIGSATSLFDSGSASYSLPVPANYFAFVSLLSDSPIVALLMGISYILAPLASICVVTLYCTRSVFAWSFDRILPDKLASVSKKTGAPIPALVFVFLLGLVYLIAIRLFGTTTLETLGATVVGSSIAFMLAALGAIVLPFWRKTRPIYELSPFRGKFLGIPVLTILGVGCFIVYAFMFIVALTQDEIGANSGMALAAQLIVLAIALVVYPISKALNRRRGVDLTLLGKELPPE